MIGPFSGERPWMNGEFQLPSGLWIESTGKSSIVGILLHVMFQILKLTLGHDSRCCLCCIALQQLWQHVGLSETCNIPLGCRTWPRAGKRTTLADLRLALTAI